MADEGVEARTGLLFDYSEVQVETQPGISLFDVTPAIRRRIEALDVQEGTIHVLSRHTTTAITINENETRLLDDVRRFLLYVRSTVHRPILSL